MFAIFAQLLGKRVGVTTPLPHRPAALYPLAARSSHPPGPPMPHRSFPCGMRPPRSLECSHEAFRQALLPVTAVSALHFNSTIALDRQPALPLPPPRAAPGENQASCSLRNTKKKSPKLRGVQAELRGGVQHGGVGAFTMPAGCRKAGLLFAVGQSASPIHLQARTKQQFAVLLCPSPW